MSKKRNGRVKNWRGVSKEGKRAKGKGREGVSGVHEMHDDSR